MSGNSCFQVKRGTSYVECNIVQFDSQIYCSANPRGKLLNKVNIGFKACFL